MAHRILVDSNGVQWDVWDVVGATWDRRLHADRRAGAKPPARPSERRRPAERRGTRGGHGPPTWLTFEAPHEKRRLQPTPDGWERLADAALEQLLASARAVPKRRSRLIE
jgi:hypothetical protein